MKKINLNTIFGTCALIIGCWWVIEIIIHPLLGIFMEKIPLSDYLFSIIILPMMAIPGVFAAYFGYRLAKEENKTNIKGSVGALAIFGVLCLPPFVEPSLPNYIASTLSFLLATAVVIPVYIFVSRFLMIQAGLKPKPKGEFVGKGILLILSWQIWDVVWRIFDAYAPIKKGSLYIKEEPWGILGFIGSIIIACLFYKVSMRFIEKDKAEPENIQPTARKTADKF